MAAVSADGSTVCVLIRRLNSSCNRSIALVVRTLRHWLGGSRVQAVAGFLQAVGNGAVFEAPLADEGLATDRDLLGRRRVDHVVVIRGDLFVQPLGGMGEQVPVLVDRAALNRHAVPDRGDGLVEPRRAMTIRNSGR